MDDPVQDRAILLAEYRFLRRLNHATAAAEALVAAVAERVPESRRASLRVVDFGSGGADIPARFLDLAARRGWTGSCLCTDRSPESIDISGARPRPGLTFRVVDVLRASETLGSKEFDVAHASLVLHHLDDGDVVRALRAMGDVTRELVVWNDLVRDRIGVVGAWLSTIGCRAELRRDAVVSVRRGFTLAEARTMAEAAGLERISVRRVRGARFVLCAAPGAAPDTTGVGRPLLRGEGLHVGFSSRIVLRDVSLVARAREMVLVSGPNGAGKSTLLSCIAGAILPRQGQVWCDATCGPPGFHPQEGGLFSALSVSGNIEIFARLAGVNRVQRAGVVREALARFGLIEHEGRAVHALSGGLLRRAAIAASFVHSPLIAILDEPDAGLDGWGREALVGAIRDVLRRDGTVILASHAPTWLDGIDVATTRIGLQP
jgi:ABC-type nitrate/sulfonate/bicarbonate transport system ATPase subunit